MPDSYRIQVDLIAEHPATTSGLILSDMHYAYPAIVFIYYATTRSVAAYTWQTKSAGHKHNRIRPILSLLHFAISTYLVQLMILAVQCLVSDTVVPSSDTIIGLLSCILVFGMELASLADSDLPIWYPFIGSLWLALLVEPIIQALIVLTSTPGTYSYVQFIDLTAVATRYLAFVTVLILYHGRHSSSAQGEGSEHERQSLIPKEDGQRQLGPAVGAPHLFTAGYGSDPSMSADDMQTAAEPQSGCGRRTRAARERMGNRSTNGGNCLAYARSVEAFFTCIWPVHNKHLQGRAVLVGLCLLGGNLVTLLMPRQLGIVTDSLNKVNDKNPWVQVLTFAALQLVNSSGVLDHLRARLWLPVDDYSYQALTTASCLHVLNLSSDFHDEKSLSDVLTAMEAGASLSKLRESVCFRAVPMLIDMMVAFIYLSLTLGLYEAFITIATAALFFHTTKRMLSALKNIRRKELSPSFSRRHVPQVDLQGWSTVASFDHNKCENGQYSTAVGRTADETLASHSSYATALAFQLLHLLCGLLAGLFLVLYQICDGTATPGQFIMLVTYWHQLSWQLASLSTLVKSMSEDLVVAGKLFEIMETKPTVVSNEGALPLDFKGGQVTFDRVTFSHDKKKEILKDFTLDVAPGTTVALVGARGAGKTTILKLVGRLYDVTDGSIKIDGQDVRDLDLASLRTQIGVVPQTPIMFDDTIINNVRYARLSATDQEVFDACEAVCLHDQIMKFPDGYKTTVGKRGIKLSGGELQRVAMARAFLKRPAILLVDEAPSAVDTDAEWQTRKAFRALCKGRTTFIAARRPSTIVDADRVVLIEDGRISEHGAHDELMRAKGRYADLWAKQVFSNSKAAKETEDQGKVKSGKNPAVVTALSADVVPLELSEFQQPVTPARSRKTVTRIRAGDDEGTAAHTREGSKLNPDAPEFTPNTVPPRAPLVSSAVSPARHWGSEAFSDGDADIGPQHVQFAPLPIVYLPGVYPTYADFSQLPENGFAQGMTLDIQGFDEPATTTGSHTSESSGGSAGLEGRAMGLRHPRYSRRIQSKSEPSSGGTTSEDS